MAMASSGTRIVPETLGKLMGGLNLSITPEDCEDGDHGAWFSEEKAGQAPSAPYAPLSSAAIKAANEYTPQNIDLISDSSSSSSSYKGKLPVVLEESESLSHREGSSVWDVSTSSSSSLSIASSSASSTRTLFRRGDKNRHNRKAREPWKRPKERSESKRLSFMSVFLWPLKKLRDGYMSCMMGLDGTGDLSGLAQGSTFATSGKYFADAPVSKTDANNYG